MQKTFITAMTREKMTSGIDPSLFTCPLPEQKIPADEGARCGRCKWNLITPWVYTVPPSLSTECPGALLESQLWWLLSQSDTWMGMSGHCCLPGEWTPDSPHHSRCHNSLIAQIPAEQCREQPSSFLLSQGTQGAPKTEPGREHPKVNKPGCFQLFHCHRFLTLPGQEEGEERFCSVPPSPCVNGSAQSCQRSYSWSELGSCWRTLLL